MLTLALLNNELEYVLVLIFLAELQFASNHCNCHCILVHTCCYSPQLLSDNFVLSALTDF